MLSFSNKRERETSCQSLALVRLALDETSHVREDPLLHPDFSVNRSHPECILTETWRGPLATHIWASWPSQASLCINTHFSAGRKSSRFQCVSYHKKEWFQTKSCSWGGGGRSPFSPRVGFRCGDIHIQCVVEKAETSQVGKIEDRGEN